VQGFFKWGFKMSKHVLTAGSGADRAAAAKDRAAWLQWQPSRGFQLKEAMINACLAYNGVHPITKRVSMNVR
jgi:hypothetical protein